MKAQLSDNCYAQNSLKILHLHSVFSIHAITWYDDTKFDWLVAATLWGSLCIVIRK